MQMREVEEGGSREDVHTMYMAHTQSGAQHVTHRLKRTRHLEDGCWMGIQRRNQDINRRQYDQAQRGGGGRGRGLESM